MVIALEKSGEESGEESLKHQGVDRAKKDDGRQTSGDVVDHKDSWQNQRASWENCWVNFPFPKQCEKIVVDTNQGMRTSIIKE